MPSASQAHRTYAWRAWAISGRVSSRPAVRQTGLIAWVCTASIWQLRLTTWLPISPARQTRICLLAHQDGRHFSDPARVGEESLAEVHQAEHQGGHPALVSGRRGIPAGEGAVHGLEVERDQNL